MHELLDEKKKIRVLLENENKYMITKDTYAKAVIETLKQDSNVLLKIYPHLDCTAEEITELLDLFSKFYYKRNPEVEGIIFKCDESPLLEQIGFKPLSENSDFLYQKNDRLIKEGRGQK